MGDWKAKSIGIPASIWRGDAELDLPDLVSFERTNTQDPDELLIRLADETAYVSFDRLRAAIQELVRTGPPEG